MDNKQETTQSGPSPSGSLGAGDTSLPQSSSRTLRSPPSEMEAKSYYAGLPSAPILVARSSTTPWVAPTGPEAYLQTKELGPVGRHAIREVWEDGLGSKICALLDSMKVEWTSIDIVRIGYDEEYTTHTAPVVIWIGVTPASLSGNDGVAVVVKCQEVLEEYNLTDVDVEIRESVVWGSRAYRS
ncbi:hypothetical protein BJ322DRAFT_1127031 [Thelephora terrestris]|uniref:Uncharacterized protein n=1 Tax=Thelephora terrestris TaxID=56493 RepID=A0A9P6H911_9AGAM|nr:hypothetical protein BJ322DRAFT_1127031 [Thelephora terrestris]